MKHRHILAIIWILILLSSCVSGKRAVKELRKDKHKLLALELCADLGEIKETIETVTDTVVKVVTLPGIELDCPETTNPTTGEKYTPKVKCPDVQQEVKYIRTKETITKENTFRVDALTLRNGKLETELAEEKDKGKKQLWFSIIMSAVAVGLFIALVRK
ncbi:hypothetical protein [Pontibacter beigongshangensis]|uniref:hypothetical protein n=1 Tax=Pontibacter beigongshangensis TaxID=2574733 RepID=UPI00164EE199|nr:hypothetical protein [Pontibacter beigongshangensis]